ncbi:hypothetical protein BHE74_00020053 [Ensete ventricosum]|nr:hypothetical protein BHE74_00020053 [Ensete ventricosum]
MLRGITIFSNKVALAFLHPHRTASPLPLYRRRLPAATLPRGGHPYGRHLHGRRPCKRCRCCWLLMQATALAGGASARRLLSYRRRTRSQPAATLPRGGHPYGRHLHERRPCKRCRCRRCPYGLATGGRCPLSGWPWPQPAASLLGALPQPVAPLHGGLGCSRPPLAGGLATAGRPLVGGRPPGCPLQGLPSLRKRSKNT